MLNFPCYRKEIKRFVHTIISYRFSYFLVWASRRVSIFEFLSVNRVSAAKTYPKLTGATLTPSPWENIYNHHQTGGVFLLEHINHVLPAVPNSDTNNIRSLTWETLKKLTEHARVLLINNHLNGHTSGLQRSYNQFA